MFIDNPWLKPYALIIDMDSYDAWRRERLIAFVTGLEDKAHTPITEVVKEKELFYEATGREEPLFSETIITRDGGQDSTLVSCGWPTPGYFSNGFKYYKDGEEAQAAVDYKDSCMSYAQRGDYKSMWAERATRPMEKAIACLSAAVFLEKAPSPQELEIVNARLLLFPEFYDRTYGKLVAITGCRVIQLALTESAVSAWTVG